MSGRNGIKTSCYTLGIVAQSPVGIRVEWTDGKSAIFHHIWLRDNCRCDKCGPPETGRRKLKLTQIPLDAQVAGTALLPDNVLALKWSDGHESSFDGGWLRHHAYDEETRRSRSFKPQLWTGKIRANPPEMDFAEVNGGDAAFLEMLHTVRDFGLCFLKNAPAEPDRLAPFAEKIGPVQVSNFGRVQDLVVDQTKRSVANRTIALKPHTDEPYRASPPGILLFHCIETDVTGAGSSIFMDGFELAKIVRSEDPEGFAALTRNRQPFRRHFDSDVDLSASFPIISVDEFGNLSGVRINDRVAAPLSIPADQVEVYYRGLKRLLELAEDPDHMIYLTLKPGDVAIFDNHRILHGRTELTMTGRRWLQWIQVERGDFHSALRIVADRIGAVRDAETPLRGAYS